MRDHYGRVVSHTLYDLCVRDGDKVLSPGYFHPFKNGIGTYNGMPTCDYCVDYMRGTILFAKSSKITSRTDALTVSYTYDGTAEFEAAAHDLVTRGDTIYDRIVGYN